MRVRAGSQLRVAEADSADSRGWGQFANPEEGESLLLEATTKQHSEDRN
jgi:hypothetical protein